MVVDRKPAYGGIRSVKPGAMPVSSPQEPKTQFIG